VLLFKYLINSISFLLFSSGSVADARYRTSISSQPCPCAELFCSCHQSPQLCAVPYAHCLPPAGVERNLVLKFKDDTIDDSIELAQLLQSSSAISSMLDLSLRTLDGDHIRPMAQVCVCTALNR
jgi:hypothetical protein